MPISGTTRRGDCGTHHRWAITTLALAALLLAGCPRVLYLDYRPSTLSKGSGPVHVTTFTYAGHPTGLMKQKELETGPKDVEALYLSQDISEFFAGALTGELRRAGYEVRSGAAKSVSGTIEHFFLDYVGEDEQQFQVTVAFSVAQLDKPPFTSTCRSNRQQTRDWMRSGLLIEQGVHACIDQFITSAQAAGAL